MTVDYIYVTIYQTGEWRVVAREPKRHDRHAEYVIHTKCEASVLTDDYWHATCFPVRFDIHGEHLCSYCLAPPNEKDLENLRCFQEMYVGLI